MDIYIFVGLPKSGKTNLIKEIQKYSSNVKHINYKTVVGVNATIKYNKTLEKLAQEIDNLSPVIMFESPFSQLKVFRQKIFKLVEDAKRLYPNENIQIYAVNMLIPYQECLYRVQNDLGVNGSTIEEFNWWADNIDFATYEEGFDYIINIEP